MNQHTTVNSHIDTDAPLDVHVTVHGPETTSTPYTVLTIGDVTLFIRDEAQLMQITAAAAEGFVKLAAARREAAVTLADES